MINLYGRSVHRLQALDWLPNLFLRLSVGFMFASGAVGKLGDLGKFTGEFGHLGIPLPGVAAPVVAVVELVGGIALMLGLGTRVASLLLAGTMVGALVTAVGPPLLEKHSTFWSFLSYLFYTPEWLLVGLLAWFVCVGAGKASVDHVITRRRGTA